MIRTLSKFAAIAVCATAIVFAQSAPTPAQSPARNKAKSLRHRLIKALDLSDAQKQQAKTIFRQARQNAAPLRQELQQNRQSMSAAVKANDTSQIRQLSTQQGNVLGQLAAARNEAMAKFYATLTPEQRAKADKIQQRVQERLAQRKNG